MEAFYAKHTFEIDFVLNENVQPVIQTLRKIYKTNKAIEDSNALLNSGDEIVVGLETLRLADKVVGKGWFALMLAEEVTYETNIPQYILDAIKFASRHIGYQHFEKMAKYRIYNSCDSKDNLEFNKLLGSYQKKIKIWTILEGL